jgi:hypothetical protein
MVLIYLRDILSVSVSTVLSNLLVVTSLALIIRGLSAFTDQRVSVGWLILPMAVSAGSSLLLTSVWPDVRIRIIVGSMINCTMLCRCLILTRTAASRQRLPVGWLGLSLGLLAGWFLVRVVLTWLFEGAVQDFMSASSIQGLTFVFYSAGNIGIFLGLLVLNSHRTEAELQQALEEVRTLQGIIPICASCKKIRDDQGAWNQLESYISQHSQARFSHGYCPDCAKKAMATL